MNEKEFLIAPGTLYRVKERGVLLVRNLAGALIVKENLEIIMYLETTEEYRSSTKIIDRFWFLDSDGEKIGCAVYRDTDAIRWFLEEKLEKVEL